MHGFQSQRVVLDYTVQLASDSRKVTDGLFAPLHRHCSKTEILNLALLVGLVQVFGQLSNALGIPMDSRGSQQGVGSVHRA